MKKATKYALINSAIAGGLVFVGSFTSGHITIQGLVAAMAASVGIFLTKLKEFYGNIQNKKASVRPGVFTFVGA